MIYRLVTYRIVQVTRYGGKWGSPVGFVKSETIPLFKPLARWVKETRADYDEAEKRDFHPTRLTGGPIILYTKIVFGEIDTQDTSWGMVE